MKLRHICFLAAVFLIARSAPLPAQDVTTTTTPAVESAESQSPAPSFLDEPDGATEETPALPDMGSTITRVIAVMLILFVALFIGLAVFQKLARRGLRIGNEKRPLQLVDRLTLGPRTSICLIRTAVFGLLALPRRLFLLLLLLVLILLLAVVLSRLIFLLLLLLFQRFSGQRQIVFGFSVGGIYGQGLLVCLDGAFKIVLLKISVADII